MNRKKKYNQICAHERGLRKRQSSYYNTKKEKRKQICQNTVHAAALPADIKVVEALKKTAERLARECQTQRREEQER